LIPHITDLYKALEFVQLLIEFANAAKYIDKAEFFVETAWTSNSLGFFLFAQ
jgi:hypothetical protein